MSVFCFVFGFFLLWMRAIYCGGLQQCHLVSSHFILQKIEMPRLFSITLEVNQVIWKCQHFIKLISEIFYADMKYNLVFIVSELLQTPFVWCLGLFLNDHSASFQIFLSQLWTHASCIARRIKFITLCFAQCGWNVKSKYRSNKNEMCIRGPLNYQTVCAVKFACLAETRHASSKIVYR